MFAKLTSTTFTVASLALGGNLGVTPNQSQVVSADNMTFVCAPQMQPPTMFAYTPGQVNLKPIMTWHKNIFCLTHKQQNYVSKSLKNYKQTISKVKKNILLMKN
jgi:esterase/lipase